MNIIINYNTISFVSKITCTDETIQNNLEQTIEENKEERITKWFETFIKQIKEHNNNDPFSIEIDGCDSYEKDFIDSILDKEKDFITSKKISSINESDLQNKYKLIDDFFQFAHNSDHKTIKNALKPKLNDIQVLHSSKVDIPVIASMSSGKSTLLNALIGQDFLAEDTGAATATICDISLDDRFKTYVARAFNDGKEIEKSSSSIKEFLKKWNSDANLEEYSKLKLNLEGPPIRNFKTSNININFVDTPGPNSSKNSNHKEQTYNYLKDNINQPIILYVLDPEKMDSTDDDNTFKEISEVIKDNKQNLNRIVFVYTKIDRELSEEKTFEEVLPKIQKFLKHRDINNPKIFPLSAKYAKFALLEKSLSRTNKNELKTFRFNFKPDPEDNYVGYQLLKYAPLTQNQKDQLKENIKKGDPEADLVYSGLAALKLHIEDYVFNHHKKNKYKGLASIANNMLDQIETSIETDKENLEEKTLIEQEVADEKAEQEKEDLNKKKIEVLKVLSNIKPNTKFINDIAKKPSKVIDKLKNKALSKGNLTPNEVKEFIEEVNNEISNLVTSFNTDLNSKFREEEKRHQYKLKNKVKNIFESNIEDSSVKSRTFKAEFYNKISLLNVNDTTKYVRDETRTRKEQKERIVPSKNWFKRLFGMKVNEKYIKESKYSVSVFNKQKFINEQLIPLNKEFIDMISSQENSFLEHCNYSNESYQDFVEISFNETIKNVYENCNTKKAKNTKEKDKRINELVGLSETVKKYR